MSTVQHDEVRDLFDREAEAFARSYETDPNFQDRKAVWTGAIDRCLSDAAGKVCVDVGCGPGVFSFYAASKGARVYGVDSSVKMLSLCRDRLKRDGWRNVTFHEASLPFADTSMFPPADIVLCSSVLEYVDDLDACVMSLASLLKASGRLLVSVPNRRSLYRNYERMKFFLTRRPAYRGQVRHEMTLTGMREVMGNHGLRILENSYYGCVARWLQSAEGLLGQERTRTMLFLVLLPMSTIR